MSTTKPSPNTWTLRFKHNRTTILLHVDPLQKLNGVRSELLKAVQQTHPSGDLYGASIPEDASDILLARPRDINDLSTGWASIEQRDDASYGENDSVKGKSKAPVTASRKANGKNALTDCPQGAGLRDGGIVAFKFRGEASRLDRDWEKIDEDGDEIKLDEDDEDGDKDPWDVIVPTIEETYGDSLPVVESMEQDEG